MSGLALTVAGSAYAAERLRAPVAKGYVVSEISVTDPALYQVYAPKAVASVAAFGGRYLVRGGRVAAAEGAPPADRIVVIEFPSAARARDFLASADYVAAAAIRHRAAKSRVYVVDGVAP